MISWRRARSTQVELLRPIAGLDSLQALETVPFLLVQRSEAIVAPTLPGDHKSLTGPLGQNVILKPCGIWTR